MSADLPVTPGPRRSDHSPWNYLLLIPIVIPLLTFLYNRETPQVFGIPFFFWFQMLLAPLAVIASVSAFYLARHTQRTRGTRGTRRARPEG